MKRKSPHFYLLAASVFVLMLLSTSSLFAAEFLQALSPLSFGFGAAGDGTKVVAAGTSENSANASFKAQIKRNAAYNVVLPTNGSVIMTTGGGGTNKEIGINDFTADTASGSFVTDGAGRQTFFVGGTRDAILATQVSGSYSATFAVTVVY